MSEGDKDQISSALPNAVLEEKPNIIMIRVSDIEVPNRFRKNSGNIMNLALSIEVLGLLHPITVCSQQANAGYRLVAGQRRLEAFKMLGKKMIPALVIGGTDAEG